MKSVLRLCGIFIFILFCLSWAPGRVGAQVEPPPDIIIDPIPPIWNLEDLRIEYQRVDVTIDNQIATTRIDQLFVNDGDFMLEGTYFFPLPPGATVTELTMWIDGIPIESKILRKEEARLIYDTIVAQLRDPALLEYVGQDAIQANVFPIPAGEERRIEIEYRQVLPADGGLIRYTFPQSTKLYTNLPLEQQSIRVEVASKEAIRSIYSPTHRVADSRDGEFRAVVGYEANNVTANTDFDLYYTVTPEEIGVNVISYKEPGQDGFFMLLAAPSVEVDEDQVVAKDVILVLDTSGSMEGEKIEQAKEAARLLIDKLNPIDRFNILTFSTGVRPYLPELVPAGDAGNVDQFINSIEALGGTNISQSLLEAVAQADDARPTTIIFMTDGLPTEGIVQTEALIDAINEETPDNVRIFAFGVGDDVDTFLLDTITSEHRGTTSYVRPSERIDEEIDAFFTKIQTPVLADISLDYGGIVVEQLYPNTLPDLFAGTQMVIVGRYRDGGPAEITLTGDVNGAEQTFVYSDITFRDSGGDDFIPRLWATRAIGNLLNEIRLKGESPELIESVINLSIRYGIITPYTSFLIEEDDILSQTERNIIIEETFEEESMEDDFSSGADAIEEAEEAADLAAAEAPVMEVEVTREAMIGTDEGDASEQQLVQQPIQFVGNKTFILRNGIWYDTEYDETQALETVDFASDAYFGLISAVPELAPAFALGDSVLIVIDGVAYQVVESGGTFDEAPEESTVEIEIEVTVDDLTRYPIVIVTPDQPVIVTPGPEMTVEIAELDDPISVATPDGVIAQEGGGAGPAVWISLGVVGALVLLIAGLMFNRRD